MICLDIQVEYKIENVVNRGVPITGGRGYPLLITFGNIVFLLIDI
jgi:hypothetical protein